MIISPKRSGEPNLLNSVMQVGDSVTRLGNFWKFSATKFLTKVAQMIGNFFGNVEKPHSNVKTAVDTFWATFGNISATFYSNIWSHWGRTLTWCLLNGAWDPSLFSDPLLKKYLTNLISPSGSFSRHPYPSSWTRRLGGTACTNRSPHLAENCNKSNVNRINWSQTVPQIQAEVLYKYFIGTVNQNLPSIWSHKTILLLFLIDPGKLFDLT